ncbi:MAG TPA: hypothetical protein VMC09_03465 [Anaerolineales bacterium]|nr:hypothetical protein [Anaerolineales bacterium]
MKRFLVSILLVVLISACTSATQVPLPTETLSNTPTPPTTDTPVPTSTGSAAPSNLPLTTAGPYLAYLRADGGQNELVFLDANGKGRAQFPLPANANLQVAQPSLSNRLSPDGKWLAYYTGSAGTAFGHVGADTADLTLNLLDLSTDSSRVVARLLSKDYPANFAQAAAGIGASVSADGLQNAFVWGITQSLAWSPDGSTLAFAGQMDGLSSDVYLYRIADQTIRRMSSGSEEVLWIAWSPDGKWILDGSSYWTGEGTVYNIYATSAADSVVRKLSTSNALSNGSLDWFNPQTYIEYDQANGTGSYGLRLVDVGTGKIVQVWSGSFSFLSIDPSRRWLAFFSMYPQLNNSALPQGPYVLDLTDMHVTPVKTANANRGIGMTEIQTLDSSPKQMFLIRDDTDGNLYYLSTDGTIAPVGLQANGFSISPDRQYWITFGDQLGIFKADGTLIRDVPLPAGLAGNPSPFLQARIVWRPDSSGIFLVYQDAAPSGASQLTYIFDAMDLLAGDLVRLDTITAQMSPDFAWVGLPK